MRKVCLIVVFLLGFSFISQIGAVAENILELPLQNNLSIESLSFRETGLNDVLRSIADIGNLNLVLDNEIKEPVTISLHKTTVKDALNSILKSHRLFFTWNGKFLHLFKNATASENFTESSANFTPLEIESSQNITVGSLDFRNTHVSDALHSLAQLINLNLVVSREVSGNMTVIFKHCSLQDAFNVILKAFFLSYTRFGNILVIHPSSFAPIFEKTVKLRNRKVSEIIDLMQGMNSSIGTFSYDIASNSITFRDEKASLNAAMKLIYHIDTISAKLGEKADGELSFIHFDSNKITLGDNVLTIKVEAPDTASGSKSIKVYLGNADSQGKQIGKFSYNSLEIGSGTVNPVEIDCVIGISVCDSVSGEVLEFNPDRE